VAAGGSGVSGAIAALIGSIGVGGPPPDLDLDRQRIDAEPGEGTGSLVRHAEARRPCARCQGVESLRSPDSTGRRQAAARVVALVSRDDLLARRVSICLASDAIGVLDRAPDVAGLSDEAGDANALVLATGDASGDQRPLIRAANARFPGVPSVVVASLTKNGVHKALEAGASGAVLDSQLELVLPATIRAVCTGQVVVPDQFRHHAARPALSHREKETLALVAAGMTNRQIADRLFLAESTVKTHLSSVFGKLGVGSRSEAAALVHDPDGKLGLSILPLSPSLEMAHENGDPGW
jgi:DNA-binding NarL/FixJ family response regulator